MRLFRLQRAASLTIPKVTRGSSPGVKRASAISRSREIQYIRVVWLLEFNKREEIASSVGSIQLLEIASP